MILPFDEYYHFAKQPCKWAIFIGGFLQDEQCRTGIEDAWVRAHNFVHRHASENTVVTYRRWNDDFAALAEKIHRLCGQQAKVAIVSYSWGTGNGALTLSKELKKRGIEVMILVSCDGVYKPTFWLTVWAALLGSMTITLPDNIQKLWWCRQFISYPRGHDLQFEDYREIPSAEHIEIDHVHIDEATEFQQAAHQAIEKLVAA